MILQEGRKQRQKEASGDLTGDRNVDEPQAKRATE